MQYKKQNTIVQIHPLTNCGNRNVQEEIDDKARRIARTEQLSKLTEIKLGGTTFSLSYLRRIKHSPNPDLLEKFYDLKKVLDSL